MKRLRRETHAALQMHNDLELFTFLVIRAKLPPGNFPETIECESGKTSHDGRIEALKQSKKFSLMHDRLTSGRLTDCDRWPCQGEI